MQIKLRKFILTTLLLWVSSNIASWLRMFNPLLGLQTWEELIGKPVKTWIGSILFYPVLELTYSWPAYVLGGILYAVLSKHFHVMNRLYAVFLGASVGFSIYILYSIIFGEWVLRKSNLIIEQLIIYTITGAFFGFLYYYIIMNFNNKIHD